MKIFFLILQYLVFEGPINSKKSLPDILVVIQICLEGEISKQFVQASILQGKKAAGDLIPWNIVEQYGDKDFARLAGARIVRIATHPNYQKVIYQTWLLFIMFFIFIRDFRVPNLFNIEL